MEFFNVVVKFFQEGGAFMYPILFVFAIGAAISVERYLYLTLAKQKNRSMWNKLTPLVKANNYQQAMAISSRSTSEVGKIMAYGLSRLQMTNKRDDIEIAMEEGLMECIPRLEKRTHYLATYANIATLLGLLGTIIGLIQAFTAVANANPADKADLLSASISVAMNTTAFGLMAAIPLLLMFTVLQTKTTEIVDSMEMATVKFLNSITEYAKKPAAKPAARAE
ncbi:MAG: MotA/TolQ/ExbB proton channel family protein [Ectothiorhodospiraceae bacterium]|nr:MotA/TolQ/ExbB proton channel family protein [Ectothiorhodospiraceae bacterium]